jgi:gamma-glutamylcyclotransferase (GGCT)/AIG2-like uncharacterized protein YtfP
MYAFGYPGVVEGLGEIKGDLYEVNDDKVMESLDQYEGHPSLFKRIDGTAVDSDGNEVPMQYYLYQHSTQGAKQIEDGDYLRHVAERENMMASAL